VRPDLTADSSHTRSRIAESLRADAHRGESQHPETGRGESLRSDTSRTEAARPAVRPIPRSTPGLGAEGTSYPTRDNLALAPQVHVRERPVPVEQDDRRYQITTLHPTTYNEARTIGEHFRDGVPVIMNLTEMAEADAKRLVDFAAGLAFGLRGSMERVTNRVFLLSPPNIEVSAEDKAKIAESGFFDQG
jgi:cell division inhibitor SepF